MTNTTLLCKFTSKINETAKGIVYELHDWNDEYYLVKWMVGHTECKDKDKKSIVDNMFARGDYIIQANE